jgi:hypothetical protein
MLSTVAAISGLYDVFAGALLLFIGDAITPLTGIHPARPPLFAHLNALFLIAVGIGYALPWREPERYRGYMWVMGPGLKGAGAALFVFEYLRLAAPPSVLLFAASDALIAGLTLVALTKTSNRVVQLDR